MQFVKNVYYMKKLGIELLLIVAKDDRVEIYLYERKSRNNYIYIW